MERALELNPWHAWSLYRQGARGEAIGRMRQAIALYRAKPLAVGSPAGRLAGQGWGQRRRPGCLPPGFGMEARG